MLDFVELIIKDFLVLWATIDPIGALAIFVGITSTHTSAERKQIARRAVLYAGMVLLLSVLGGQLVLAGMGIRMISLQVAGGIILFIFSLQMIFGNFARSHASNKPTKSEEGHDIAVFPLAIPAIATPGAIMAAILLTDNNVYTFPQQIATTGTLIFVLILTYIMLLFSETILKYIGKNGALIMVKVMGMLLAALSVELIMEAIGIERWLSH
jgi:multiple antibiotic resistance protein